MPSDQAEPTHSHQQDRPTDLPQPVRFNVRVRSLLGMPKQAQVVYRSLPSLVGFNYPQNFSQPGTILTEPTFVEDIDGPDPDDEAVGGPAELDGPVDQDSLELSDLTPLLDSVSSSKPAQWHKQPAGSGPQSERLQATDHSQRSLTETDTQANDAPLLAEGSNDEETGVLPKQPFDIEQTDLLIPGATDQPVSFPALQTDQQSQPPAMQAGQQTSSSPAEQGDEIKTNQPDERQPLSESSGQLQGEARSVAAAVTAAESNVAGTNSIEDEETGQSPPTSGTKQPVATMRSKSNQPQKRLRPQDSQADSPLKPDASRQTQSVPSLRFDPPQKRTAGAATQVYPNVAGPPSIRSETSTASSEQQEAQPRLRMDITSEGTGSALSSYPTEVQRLASLLSESDQAIFRASSHQPAFINQTSQGHRPRSQMPVRVANDQSIGPYLANPSSRETDKIEQLQHLIQELRAKVAALSADLEQVTRQEQFASAQFPPEQAVPVTQQAAPARQTPRAFWERRYLSRSRLRGR